jgi:hypothetical protein
MGAILASRLFSRRRVVLLVLGAGAVGVSLAVMALGSHTAHATLPPPFQAAQTALSSTYGIETAAAASTQDVRVMQQQAVKNALARMSRPLNEAAKATLVTVTDTRYVNHAQPDAPGVPVLANRMAWLVLIPNVSVPIVRPYRPWAPAGPGSYTATLAVFIDANTGEFLEAASLAG